MSKELSVILLGFSIIIITQLGIPGTWRTALLVLAGAAIASIGFFLRTEALTRARRSRHAHFVENETEHHSRHGGSEHNQDN
jgi:hypothetical protein